MADDLNKQLGIQTQINKVLEQRSKVLEAQAGLLSGQAQMAKELCKALECSDLDDMEERLAGIQAGMEEAAIKAEEMGTATSEALAEAADAAGEEGGGGLAGALSSVASQLTAGRMAAVGAGVGMITALKGAGSQAQGLTKMIGSVATGFLGVGKSLIALPFSILGGLTQQANDLYNGMNPLREAIEDVREQFGSLSSNEGAAVMGAFSDIRSEAGNVAGSGMSMASRPLPPAVCWCPGLVS